MESIFDVSDEKIVTAKEIRRLVLQVCNHTPWQSKCLVRAILTQHLLKQRNIPSTLYLGVNKNESGEMQAHAWLRFGEIIIMGEKIKMASSKSQKFLSIKESEGL